MRGIVKRMWSRRQGGGFRWPMSDWLVSDLGLSKQSQGLLCGVCLHLLFCWAPCPAHGRHGKQNSASWKIASLPRLEKCSVPTCFRWPQRYSFSPNAFSFFSKSDRGKRGVHVMPALVSSDSKCLHAHTCAHTLMHAHACSHFILTRFPGGERPL